MNFAELTARWDAADAKRRAEDRQRALQIQTTAARREKAKFDQLLAASKAERAALDRKIVAMSEPQPEPIATHPPSGPRDWMRGLPRATLVDRVLAEDVFGDDPGQRESVRFVLNQLPDEAFDRLWVQGRTAIILGGGNSDTGGMAVCNAIWFTAFAIVFHKHPDLVTQKLLAHELAHVFLKHRVTADTESTIEQEARDLQFQWGFGLFS